MNKCRCCGRVYNTQWSLCDDCLDANCRPSSHCNIRHRLSDDGTLDRGVLIDLAAERAEAHRAQHDDKYESGVA